MSQILQQQEVKFGDVNAKLYQVFEWADKNLMQIRYWVGDIDKSEACVLGAFNFWFSNGSRKTGMPYDFSKSIYEKWRKLEKHYSGDPNHFNPVSANNNGTTFKEFTDICRELNI